MGIGLLFLFVDHSADLGLIINYQISEYSIKENNQSGNKRVTHLGT